MVPDTKPVGSARQADRGWCFRPPDFPIAEEIKETLCHLLWTDGAGGAWLVGNILRYPVICCNYLYIYINIYTYVLYIYIYTYVLYI